MEILKPLKTPKHITARAANRAIPEGERMRELAVGSTLPIRCDIAEKRRLTSLAQSISWRSREYVLRTRYKAGVLYIAKFAR